MFTNLITVSIKAYEKATLVKQQNSR